MWVYDKQVYSGHTVPFKSKLTVCCESQFSTRFSIPARIEYREPFIENREPVCKNRELLIANRVKDRV